MENKHRVCESNIFFNKFFSKEEIYGLTSQMRRAAVSIPSNIAEGAARNSTKEYIHFLYISLGSLAELETQLILTRGLSYISKLEYERINAQLEEIRKKLLNFIKYLKQKQLTHKPTNP